MSPRLALGREIVRALSGERAGVLERWMAHHIAELMERVEEAEPGSERDAAAAACRTAILDAWSKRQSWPYGAPLERVANALSVIAGPPDDVWAERDRPTSEPGWFGLFDTLSAIESEEHRIVFDVGVAEMDIEAERKALEAAGDLMDDREREILELLTRRSDEMDAGDYKLGQIEAPQFRSMEADGQIDVIRRAFAAAAKRRLRAIEDVLPALGT